MLRCPAAQPGWGRLLGLRTVAPLLPLFAALSLVSILLEGTSIGLLIPLLSLLISGGFPGSVPAPLHFVVDVLPGRDPRASSLFLAGTIVTLIIVKGVVQAGADWLAAIIEERIGRELRLGLTDMLLGLEYPFFLQPVTARLTNILSTQNWLVLDAVHSALALLPAVVALLVFAALLAWLSLKLFLIVLVGAAVIEPIMYLVKRRQEKLSNELPSTHRRLLERFMTLVHAPRVVRLFGQQERERQRTEKAVEALRENLSSSQKLKAVADPLLDAVMTLLLLVVLLAGYASGMSVPSIAAFLVILTRAQPHARRVSMARLSLASVRGSLHEVQWLLSQPAHPISASASSATIRLDQPIVFESISFTYPNGNPALDNVSFSIPAGEVTAIVGDSGSGKTTLVNILCRLLEPRSGEVRLGDVPASDFAPDEWRRRIAVAGQDTELVSGTVLENIRYGNADADMTAVEAAARAAGADMFIRGLPSGHDTHVGTQGLNLSGGQRQRIAIARALLTGPDLLVLDEATNAVDAITETEIMRLITEHRWFHTLVVISHRRTTLAVCENGIVLDGGRVVETGRLKNLSYFKQIEGRDPEAASV